uniref:uncharacterized protein LOC109952513 isoform X2 n=1 Tax=Monopterus albus TaxID=43700 RepID=UPI0009B43EA7|nr:uncharacterized protein LOC109952513 isoform X2 [Monopterus albus]
MLPSRTLSKEYFSETNLSTGDSEDGEQNGMEYQWFNFCDQKKTVKTKVNQLLRKTSTSSPVLEKKHMNGHLPQESKDDGIKKNSMQRSEEGTVLDNTTGEEEGVSTHGEKGKKKMKIGFVPHRGFTITLEKNDDKLKGVQGSRPRVSSKELQDEVFSPSIKKSQAAVMDVEHMEKAHGLSSPGLNGDIYGVEDCKPKKQGKLKLPRFRHSSQEYMLDRSSPQNKKKSFSVEELNDELTWMEDGKLKKPKHKGPSKCNSKTIYNTAGQSEQDGFEDELAGKEVMSPAEMYDTEDDEADTCKPTKSSKPKGIKHKTKSKAALLEVEDSPGATSSDYLSEAAKAEWLAAQRDERTIAGLEDEDEDGDTDSLMEWWYTVEQWDEVPSDDEDIINKDESKSFTILADKVQRGLCVFNKVFTERAEVLWQSIITLNTVADDINDFHHKARIAGITGGTTTAVGGATAIAGLALAPFTFGASLVVTAVGVGVAAAGGIASASAAISDNVNNMNDRKKVETVLREYEVNLLDIGKILHFVNQGLYKLRGHPFLRSGTQHYSEDWEIRKAVQMIGLVDLSVMRGTEATDQAVASIQGLFKGMDRYFIKDTRELKKGCKKEIVGQIKAVASVLNDAVMELNGIREEIQEAIGQV